MTEFTPSEQRQLDLARRLEAEWAAYLECVGALADIAALMALSSTAMELALEITADEIGERECDCRLTMEPRRVGVA